jgi:hypothetical protein
MRSRALWACLVVLAAALALGTGLWWLGQRALDRALLKAEARLRRAGVCERLGTGRLEVEWPAVVAREVRLEGGRVQGRLREVRLEPTDALGWLVPWMGEATAFVSGADLTVRDEPAVASGPDGTALHEPPRPALALPFPVVAEDLRVRAGGASLHATRLLAWNGPDGPRVAAEVALEHAWGRVTGRVHGSGERLEFVPGRGQVARLRLPDQPELEVGFRRAEWTRGADLLRLEQLEARPGGLGLVADLVTLQREPLPGAWEAGLDRVVVKDVPLLGEVSAPEVRLWKGPMGLEAEAGQLLLGCSAERLVGLELALAGGQLTLAGTLQHSEGDEGRLQLRAWRDGGAVLRASLAFDGCLALRPLRAWLATHGLLVSPACQDHLELEAALDGGRLSAAGWVEAARWSLEAPGVARGPVADMGFSAGFDAGLDLDSGRAVLRLAPLKLGPLHLEAFVAWERSAAEPRVELCLRVPEQPCERLIRAVPEGLRGRLAGMRLGGELKLELAYAADFNRVFAMYQARARGEEEPYRSDLTLTGEDRCTVEAPPRGVDLEALNRPDYVCWMSPDTDDGATEADPTLYPAGPGTEGFVPLARIPTALRTAALQTEDVMFYEHRGVNPGLVRTAFELDVWSGRFAYGGSTITQQLVKNLFLSREKTLSRKFEELILSLYLETRVPKDRILELYLNCIEFGRGIYGIGAAARAYFDKPVEALAPEEVAFLMACKPVPRDCQRALDRRQPLGPLWKEKIEYILDRMVRSGAIDQEDYRHALAREVRFAPPD